MFASSSFFINYIFYNALLSFLCFIIRTEKNNASAVFNKIGTHLLLLIYYRINFNNTRLKVKFGVVTNKLNKSVKKNWNLIFAFFSSSIRNTLKVHHSINFTFYRQNRTGIIFHIILFISVFSLSSICLLKKNTWHQILEVSTSFSTEIH